MTSRTYDPFSLGFDTFVLGVGAQKSGTNWVYDYLSKHPQCTMPTIKELHFFDTCLQPETFKMDPDRRYRDHLFRIDHLQDSVAMRRTSELKSRLRVSGAFASYLNFFADMGIENRMTGDITPSYAGPSADDFRRIREYLLAAGLKIRVVFLMRDPIERVQSAARMFASQQMRQAYPEFLERRLIKKLKGPALMG